MQTKFYIYCPTCNGTRTSNTTAQPCPQCLGQGMIEYKPKGILDFADVKIESDPDNDTFSASVKLDRPLSVGGGSGKNNQNK